MIEIAAPPVVAEPITPIKPSEALRLGRLVRPRRTTGTLFRGPDEACALGSMLAGVGVGPRSDDDDTDLYIYLKTRWPELPLGQTFNHNDFDGWSDDQIVAWLQGLGL